MKTTYFYSLSSIPRNYPLTTGKYTQLEWLLFSIDSLKKHVEEPDIRIAYTPPYDEEEWSIIKELGGYKRPHMIEKIFREPPKNRDIHKRGVFDRAWVHEITDADIIFSVDSDINFYNDPIKIYEDEYDVYGFTGVDNYTNRNFLSIRFLIYKYPFNVVPSKLWVERYNEANQFTHLCEILLYETIEECGGRIKTIEPPSFSKYYDHHRTKMMGCWYERNKSENT